MVFDCRCFRASSTEYITVTNPGQYHVSYGIDSEHDTADINQRFAHRTKVQVDSGSGFSDAGACFGSSFARGLGATNHDQRTATPTANCILELDTGDKLRIVSNIASTTMSSSDQLTTPFESYLAIHYLTISNPTLEESLSLDDQVEVLRGKIYSESLAFFDTLEFNQDAKKPFTESLTLAETPLFIDKSGQVLCLHLKKRYH